MCGIHCGVSRTTLWISWSIATVLAFVYGALSVKTFYRIEKIYGDAEDPDNETRAVLVAAFAGPLVVVAFTVLSLFLLLSKQVSSSGVGFYYGFVNASALNMALFSLLCGLIMFTFEDDIENSLFKEGEEVSWNDTDSNVMKSTYWFAFVTTGGYFAFFLIMFLASFTIQRQSSLLEEDREP